MNMERVELFKPGTAEYYRDVLENIYYIALDYDGYDIKDAKQMKELVDELKNEAKKGLKHKYYYLKTKDKDENKN